MIRTAFLLSVLLFVPLAHADKQLIFLFTGDNGGEVAPCG